MRIQEGIRKAGIFCLTTALLWNLSLLDSSQVWGAQAEENASVIQEASLSELSCPSGWSETAATDSSVCYQMEERAGQEEISTITCSYIQTDYSVQEYEKLRDMLSSQVVYANVKAQVSISASYTNQKDYLYIILSDDASFAYRDIYYYVVGDYTCFLTHVKEYRNEAEQTGEEGKQTPEEAGKELAVSFCW